MNAFMCEESSTVTHRKYKPEAMLYMNYIHDTTLMYDLTSDGDSNIMCLSVMYRILLNAEHKCK